MAKSLILDFIRILPRETDFLERKVGSRGEIFYDRSNNTLRLYDGVAVGGFELVKNDLTNIDGDVFKQKAEDSGIVANTTVSANPPEGPRSGELWFDIDTAQLYLYYQDGDSSQWVQPASIATGSGGAGGGNADPEYNNGAISNVVGDGSDFFKREVTTNGVRVMGAGTVGGQTAVPDAWLEKVARMFELFTDPDGAGINQSQQRALIKTLSGDTGTYHAGQPTIQRVARGAGADYSPNFLTDPGIVFWNLTNLFDTHVQNDMVWYLNSTGDGYGDGDIDAQEVIEHVFHTLHMHGLPADDIKLYQFLAADWQSGDLYAAMEEAYDAGKWDSSGYGGNAWKTDADAFEVAAKEYLYLLNFAMFEYTELWDGGSLAPEWTDDMRTQAGIQANNPLGYAFHNTYIAPVISKPSLATIRSIFQDGNTPAQDNPALAGASGYVVDEGGSGGGNAFRTIAIDGQSDVVADSSTDTLTLVAGTNVTLTTDADNDTITISAIGGVGASNSFVNIAVNGQNTVVAESTTDTLTLVAGTGIQITTDQDTDAVTITSSVTSGATLLTGLNDVSTAALTVDKIYKPAVAMLTVTNSGTSAYLFNSHYSGSNPSLYAISGTTIAFNLNVVGHPFELQSAVGTPYSVGLTHVATDGTVSTGANAQGKVSGTLYWDILRTVAGTFRYQCQVHGAMVGQIIVKDITTV